MKRTHVRRAAANPGSSSSSLERVSSFRVEWLRAPCAVAASLLLLFLCTACTDISAVAKFAATAKKAASGFSDIAGDFSGSATRRAFYVSSDQKPAALAQAQHYKELEPQIKASQKILVDYIAALAGLSADSTTARDKSIQATQGDLKQLGMSSDQAAAGVAIANKLADLLMSNYQSRKLDKAIRETNAPLQEYLQGLEHIVSVDYIDQLNGERVSVRAYYSDAIHEHGATEPLAAMLANMQRDADLQEIDDRQKAAVAYNKILVDIGGAHQKLYDDARLSDKKHLEMLLEPYMNDISEQASKLAKAF
jgi:hypothetical protein